MAETPPTLAESLEGVDGWLYLDEAEALQRAVQTHPLEPTRPITVVEIGTYAGRSAIALALAVQARPGAGRVYAIDPHEMGSETIFRTNLADRGLQDTVEPVLERSDAARGIVADGSVHVLFIDGAHDYKSVLRDLQDWIPTLANEAALALNDTHWPGVHRAVSELLLGGEPFFNPRLVRSTLFLDVRTQGVFGPRDRRALLRLKGVLYLRLVAGYAQKAIPKAIRQWGNKVTERLTSQ